MQAYTSTVVEIVFSWREVVARVGFMGVTQLQHDVGACGILKRLIGRMDQGSVT